MSGTCWNILRPLLPVSILFLQACASGGGYHAGDGPPKGEFNVASVQEPVPRHEPISRYGNPESYRVNGRTYFVRASRYGYKQRGIASWYGTKFHGRRTSSGEPYNMYAMTAAHTTLPLPTYVQVTNLENGRKVVVKVNDRGPFHSNRIIDLSYAAARKLGIAANGTGLVEVESINPDHWRRPQARQRPYALQAFEEDEPTEAEPATVRLFLQVGAFSERANAHQLRRRLAELALQTPIRTLYSAEHDLYRVRIGPVDSVEQADRLARMVTDKGFDTPHIVVD